MSAHTYKSSSRNVKSCIKTNNMAPLNLLIILANYIIEFAYPQHTNAQRNRIYVTNVRVTTTKKKKIKNCERDR